MFLRRLLGLPLLFLFLSACGSTDGSGGRQRLMVGVVSYGQGNQSVEQFDALKTHLEAQLKSVIELEPTFNEVKAVQQIETQTWDVVFAPPGLAAIAISDHRYTALLPQQGGRQERSVIVVKENSPIQKLNELGNKVVALGQEGSATGYYFPVFNLYGLTLAEARFAPTPKNILEWIEKDEVAAGALSVDELDKYRPAFSQTKFRILYRDTHNVPPGSVLVGPKVERNTQEQIKQALESVAPSVAAAAGYIPNTKPVDYSYLIKVVKQVRPIAKRIKEKPAPLY